MDRVEIKEASSKHSERIQELLKQLGYEASLEQIEKNLVNNVLIALEEDEVVGFMSLIFFDYFPTSHKVCRITAIVVDEAFRGKGIGSQLIDFAKEMAVDKGCNALEVTTSLQRASTQAYYESIGFKKTSFRYLQEL